MRDIFYPGMKYLYEKYCPSYAGILHFSRDGLKRAPASYKRNNKRVKKLVQFSDLVYYPLPLLSRPGSHINNP